jgi:predicted ABC-type ATPase
VVKTGIIRVLAGTNGAGKSSVGGAHLRASGAKYFNPDELARELLASGADASLAEANSHAWKRGVAELRRAIDGGTDFTFETTLGGNTVTPTHVPARRLNKPTQPARVASLTQCSFR